MAARLTRAKKKIAAARIPYRVPPADELPARIDAVLTVVHLLFTTGHTAPAGDDLVRRDLVERSLDLARMLRALLPQDANVAGLLALILLTDARSATRVEDGRLLLLAEQDRAQWDRHAISEGVTLVREALRGRPPGRFALMAASPPSTPRHRRGRIPTGVKCSRSTTCSSRSGRHRWWHSTVPSPSDSPTAPTPGSRHSTLSPPNRNSRATATCPPRADFLHRLGRTAEVRASYEEALLLTENTIERDFLATPACSNSGNDPAGWQLPVHLF